MSDGQTTRAAEMPDDDDTNEFMSNVFRLLAAKKRDAMFCVTIAYGHEDMPSVPEMGFAGFGDAADMILAAAEILEYAAEVVGKEHETDCPYAKQTKERIARALAVLEIEPLTQGCGATDEIGDVKGNA